MNQTEIERLLEGVRSGSVTIDDATAALSTPYIETPTAKIDVQRRLRRGLPEVVFCKPKRPEQVAEIFYAISKTDEPVLGTKAENDHWQAVREALPDASYDEIGRLLLWTPAGRRPVPIDAPPIAIVSAGTSDEPILREAAGTLDAFGVRSVVIRDSGVAGLQRILAHVEELESSLAVIVIAGMDGALPSVVSGLISTPVIAVPTSVGYGANFGGLSALLAMLNNCSSGVSVVNIDNGFGAAYAATLHARKYVDTRNEKNG